MVPNKNDPRYLEARFFETGQSHSSKMHVLEALFFQITLLKTNTSLLKTGALPQKERILSQSAIFTGELLVSGMEASF